MGRREKEVNLQVYKKAVKGENREREAERNRGKGGKKGGRDQCFGEMTRKPLRGESRSGTEGGKDDYKGIHRKAH